MLLNESSRGVFYIKQNNYLFRLKENHLQIEHQCKTGFVSVLEVGELDRSLGERILNLINGI
jgi:hypothetical protein